MMATRDAKTVARIYILLGGFAPGPDGFVTSAGMYGLEAMLTALPNVVIKTYPWSDFESAAADIAKYPQDKHILIGYSGGGWRALSLANLPSHPAIDLMVLYDPSPTWKVSLPENRIKSNVKKVISFQNSNPMFGNLGGGVIAWTPGMDVEIVPIAENHMVVQDDMSLHHRTVEEVQKIIT